MNKRGFVEGFWKATVTTFIILVVLGLIMSIFWLWAILAPPTKKAVLDINGNLDSAIDRSNNEDLEQAASPVIGAINEGSKIPEWWGYSMFIVSLLTLMIFCAYVKSYKWLLPIWIVAGLIAVFVALYFSIAYESVSANNYYNGEYESWEANDYMMEYLPVIIAAVVIIGGTLMYMMIPKDQSEEGNYEI